MIDIKNVLEATNEIIILPITIITFIILICISIYLRRKDPDVIRSRIFLKFGEIKKAFILLVAFALILILHVSLIYLPRFFSFYDPLFDDMQQIFGLVLILILSSFVLLIYKGVKE